MRRYQTVTPPLIRSLPATFRVATVPLLTVKSALPEMLAVVTAAPSRVVEPPDALRLGTLPALRSTAAPPKTLTGPFTVSAPSRLPQTFSVRPAAVLAPLPSCNWLPPAMLIAPLPVQAPLLAMMPLAILLVPLLLTVAFKVRVPALARVPEERLTEPLTVPVPLRMALVTATAWPAPVLPLSINCPPGLIVTPPPPPRVALAGMVKVPLLTLLRR